MGRHQVKALKIKGVSVCEKIRHVVTADVILLTHGSDYIMASLAREGTVIIHYMPYSARWMDFKTLYGSMNVSH